MSHPIQKKPSIKKIPAFMLDFIRKSSIKLLVGAAKLDSTGQFKIGTLQKIVCQFGIESISLSVPQRHIVASSYGAGINPNTLASQPKILNHWTLRSSRINVNRFGIPTPKRTISSARCCVDTSYCFVIESIL